MKCDNDEVILQVKLDQFGHHIFLIDTAAAVTTNGLEKTIATIVQHFQSWALFDDFEHMIGGIGQ